VVDESVDWPVSTTFNGDKTNPAPSEQPSLQGSTTVGERVEPSSAPEGGRRLVLDARGG
jgi:hypothetical protein